MDSRVKELIAVGTSVAVHCQPCLKLHVSKAQESGAHEQEILEAIAVGKMVAKGATDIMDKFASTVFKAAEATAEASKNPCCG